MNFKLLLIGQLIVLLLAGGLLSSLSYGLSHAFQRLRLPVGHRGQVLQLIITACIFWLAILALLAYMGFFYGPELSLQRILLAFLFPALLAGILLFSRFFRLVLAAIPNSWLTYFQSCRIITELLFWMGLQGGFVPIQMTFEWLNYDIIVGVTALLGGYVFFGKGRNRRLEGILWNTFGLASLVNMILISLVSLPGPHQVFSGSQDSAFLTLVPFIWLPGFIFPLCAAIHLFSLKKLIFSGSGRSRQFLSRRRN